MPSPSASHLRLVPPPSGSRPRPERDPGLAALVARVAAGDEEAFARLVARFEGTLRGTARRYRLCHADVDDALQITWLRLWEGASRIREPAALAGWLTTTLRRECMRILNQRMIETPTDECELGERPGAPQPEEELFEADRRRALATAIGELPGRHRHLMQLLASDAELSYREVGEALGVSLGWIGPTRQRCIERLRAHDGLRAVAGD
jgi:RNA polymerase sigma factor (sigma-70 family)